MQLLVISWEEYKQWKIVFNLQFNIPTIINSNVLPNKFIFLALYGNTLANFLIFYSHKKVEIIFSGQMQIYTCIYVIVN